jgi:hypothetical protein
MRSHFAGLAAKVVAQDDRCVSFVDFREKFLEDASVGYVFMGVDECKPM